MWPVTQAGSRHNLQCSQCLLRCRVDFDMIAGLRHFGALVCHQWCVARGLEDGLTPPQRGET